MATTSTTSPYTNPFQAESVYIFSFDPSANSSQRTADTTHTIGYLPANFVITQAWIHVLTTFVSTDGVTPATDACTIALGYTGAADAFDAAIAISNGGNPWDAAAPRVSDGAADGAVGNFITAAAGDAVLATTAASEALTAGKLLLVIKGYTTT